MDEKALYTIQADQPNFLIPFRYRCMDGEAECTYQLGSLSKLLYRFGSRPPEEFADFWGHILQPLLDCGDWFLNPFSFVLGINYMYINKTGNTVSYLYAPSRQACADSKSLQSMVAELAQKNPSTDAALEVKALRAIMQDFQPKTFLQMLRESLPATPSPTAVPTQPADRIEPAHEPAAGGEGVSGAVCACRGVFRG